MTQVPGGVPVAPIVDPPKAGVTTSEFWKSIIADVVAGFVVVWGVTHDRIDLMEWGLAAMAGSAGLYTVARSVLKARSV